jgi:hypothetical protein
MGDGPPTLKDLSKGKLAHEKAPPPMPEQQSLGEQTAETLAVQHQYAPTIFEDYKKFAPQYDQVDMDRMAGMLPGMRTINDELSNYYYGQMRGYNPELYGNLSKLDNFKQIGEQSLAPSAISSALTTEAQKELALGSSLSPEEVRQAQQASRAAYASRGMSDNNASMADEILSQYNVGQQRMRERQAFAQSIDQGNFGQRMDLLNYNMGANDFNRSSALNAANARAAVAYNPATQTFGTGQQILGQNSQQVNGMFNPNNQYAQDYYNTKFNANMSAYNSQLNNKAASRAGMMQGGGAIAGAALMAF